MNKPKKPRKPSEPREVSQTFPKPKKRLEYDHVFIDYSHGEHIQQVIDRAGTRLLRENFQFESDVSLSDIQINCGQLRVNVKSSWDNPIYDIDMERFPENCQKHEAKYTKYLEDLKKFDAKMEKYGKKLKSYQKDLETWQQLENAKELAKKEAQYEKLAKELGKPT